MRPHEGFSLVELMISLTLGLLVLAGLVTTFAGSSRSRDEVERANQQIESGRYAMQVLTDDLRLAGYLGEFNIAQAGLALPAALPDPCAADLPTLRSALPLHVQGVDNGPAPACLPGVRANTDILVIRRASTCVSGDPGCAGVAAGAPYLQVSRCNSATQLGSSDATNWFRLDMAGANLDRQQRDCDPARLAATRRYLTHLYFIDSNNQPNDGVPTLKRAELGAGGGAVVPLAEGVENLQIEYGINTDGKGPPNVVTADPSTYGACTGAACVTNWSNVVSVKISLLVRSTTRSSDYTDGKTYALGLLASGVPNNLGPFNDAFKRHVFQSEVRLINPSARRE